MVSAGPEEDGPTEGRTCGHLWDGTGWKAVGCGDKLHGLRFGAKEAEGERGVRTEEGGEGSGGAGPGKG